MPLVAAPAHAWRSTLRVGAPIQVSASVRQWRRVLAIAAATEKGCIMVGLPPGLAADCLALAAHIPDAALAEKGRDDWPHVTVLYGVTTPTDILIERVRQIAAATPPVFVRLGATAAFPYQANPKRPFDVVRLDVDSQDLHRLRGALQRVLDVEGEFSTYTPHVTLAYVRPGAANAAWYDPALFGRTAVIDTLVVSDAEHHQVTIPLTGVAVTAGSQPTLCIDFDNTIADTAEYRDGVIPEVLLPGARAALESLAMRFRVVIFTARPLKDVRSFIDRHGLQLLIADVTNRKVPAIAYIDDRAIPFRGDWAATLRNLNDVTACIDDTHTS